MKTKLMLLNNAAILLAILSFAPTLVFSQPGGSLTPPGPPGVSMKTLDEVEPRIPLLDGAAGVTTDASYELIIGQPGSYYLTGNLAVTKFAGILVQAEGVTVDLNGFEIRRAGGSFGYGIQVTATSHRSTIVNGSITGGVAGFQNGVFCSGTPFPTRYARAGFLHRVSVSGCSGTGIFVGEGWRIDGCTAHENDGSGMVAPIAGTFTDCIAYDNGGTEGIFAGTGSTLTGCAAYANRCRYGIRAGDGSTLTDCTAAANKSTDANGYGIHVEDDSTLTNCTAFANSHTGSDEGYGIRADGSSSMTNCTANNNTASGLQGYGIRAGEGSTLSSCAATGNNHTGSFVGYGIQTGFGSTLINCTARANIFSGVRGDAIYTFGRSTLSNCTAESNVHLGSSSSYGIHANSSSVLTNCNAGDNTSAGSRSAGIFVQHASAVIGCVAARNENTSGVLGNDKGTGIDASIACTVKDCNAAFNTGAGISAGGNCLVKGNNCDGNGGSTTGGPMPGDGAGIHVSSGLNAGTRVEGNNVSRNDRGIEVDGAGNIVLRNTASDNTVDYDVDPASAFGPIINVIAGGDISGTIGADHPWANFRY